MHQCHEYSFLNSVLDKRSSGDIGSPMGQASSTAVPEPSGWNHAHGGVGQVDDAACTGFAEVEIDLVIRVLL
nr:MAG TPA: hypothetical protein [Caudoviricetes sp.]